MAGIGAAAQGAPQGAPQEQPQATPEGQDGGDQPNVSPEEQAAYDEFVTNGMHLIYQGDHVAPAVLAQLKGDWKGVEPSLGQIPDDSTPLDPKSPTDNLAVATVALVLALEASAAHSNAKVDGSVLFHGGAELMEQLADIAQAAKIHDFTDDEMTGAANRAALLYGVSSKTMDKQEALAEFDHFLKTQGDSLGQSLSSMEGQGQQEQPPAQPEQGA